MTERFPALREDITALYVGYYVAELLADGTQDYDPHPALFDAALGTLRGLRDTGRAGSACDPSTAITRVAHAPGPPVAAGGCPPPSAVVMSFELVWLKELGYSPRLDACAACGSDVPREAVRVLFSPSAGGVLCPACGPGSADRRSLSAAGLAALWRLTAEAEEGARSPELPVPVRGELRQLLGQVVSYVLGRRPRLLGYVEGAERRS
jgi:DNA repair protein RecO (recombination protein O)